MKNESFVDFYCRWNLFCLFEMDGYDQLDEKLLNRSRVEMGIPSIYEEGEEPTVEPDMSWTVGPFNTLQPR